MNGREGGVVYFIQAAHGGPIKIGYCSCEDGVANRLAGLQTGNPHVLRVCRVIPANGVETEREWHQRFARWRMAGEWFIDDPEVVMATGAKLPEPRSMRELKKTIENAYKAGVEDGKRTIERRLRGELMEFFELAKGWMVFGMEDDGPPMFEGLRVLRRRHRLPMNEPSTFHVPHTTEQKAA